MAGGRPSKPLHLVQGHRTKAEKQIREKAERELLTGVTMKASPEVKDNPLARKEFNRVRKIFKSIDKDDDLYGNIINTHCLLVAEIKDMELTRTEFVRTLEQFEVKAAAEEITFSQFMQTKMKLQEQIIALDKLIMTKRKMILDISKENIMTVQSALRSIPKKPDESKKGSAMAEFMKRRGGNA